MLEGNGTLSHSAASQSTASRARRGTIRSHFIGLFFLAVGAVLVASSILVFEAGQVVFRADEDMASRLMVLQNLDDFLSSVKDAETGQRGYLLTGRDSYLAPYNQGRAAATNALAGLERLAACGQLPQENVQKTAELTRKKLAELEETIQLARTSRTNAAVAIVHKNIGQELMESLRAEVTRMRAQQQDGFAAAAALSRRATILRNATFLTVGLGNLAFLAWAYHKISNEVRRREAAMREAGRQSELLATILTSVGDAVIATDAETRVIFLNSQAELLTGWKSGEASGRPLSEVFSIINENSRQKVDNPVEKVLRSGRVVGLANHTLLISKEGREIPIDDSAAPIRQEDGAMMGVVLIFRDFTERRKVEKQLQEAHQQLSNRAVHLENLVQQRTAKLNELVGDLEAFSYSLVHDMRGPLRAMQSFAQLMAEECSPLNEAAEGYLHRIKRAAQRLDRLIQDGFNYSRMLRGDVPMGPVDPNALLAGMIETYPAFQRPQAEIQVDSPLPKIMANEAFLTQCLSNLLGNAVKFVEAGRTPRVQIWAESNKERVRLFFKDNGIGIKADHQEKIFQIFQRLETSYEGTGVGLAIVKKAAERMGGKVGVQSEPGNGSTFWLELPAAEA